MTESHSTVNIRNHRNILLLMTAVPIVVIFFVSATFFVANTLNRGANAATTIKGDVSTAPAAIKSDPNVLWVGTFDNPGDWKQNWGVSQSGYSENLSISQPSFALNGKLGDYKVAGSSDQSQKWGADIRTDFKQMGIGKQEEAYFRYNFYLPANFDCVEGGKLPGLSGITEGDKGYSTSAGGEYSERSWSGRLYWHKDVDGKGCGLVSYMYVKHADGKDISNSTGRYVGIAPRWYYNADSSSWSNRMAIKKGQWNSIEVYYKMNTPGQNNGIHRGWLNGQIGLDVRDVQYRTAGHSDLGINQIFSVIFFGGPLGPKTTQHVYLDNLVVAKARAGQSSASPAPAPVVPAPKPTTPSPVTPTPPPATPSTPKTPSTPVKVPGANPTTPVPIPTSVPTQQDGTLIADFNGDGINEIARDDNNDGSIDPTTEVIAADAEEYLDEIIAESEYSELQAKNISNKSNTITVKAGPLPEIKIAKPVAYTFAIAQGVLITGLGAYLAVTKLAIFAGFRNRIGL